MNLQKIYQAALSEWVPENYPIYKDVAKRLDKIFGEELNAGTALVLMRVLDSIRIEFHDGFVFNGDKSDECMMGHFDLAVLISGLCNNPDQDCHWWLSYFHSGQFPPNTNFEKLRYMLAGKICLHPSVKCIS